MDDYLRRFVDAQDDDGIFERAMQELSAGHKETHWIWFVFPQIAGLGSSPMARRFAIRSLDEAAAYLTHPVLGPRLLDAGRRMATAPGLSAAAILGPIDATKLRSSMTLFHRADPDEPVFTEVLERFFGGTPDPATDRLLARGA